MDAFQEKIEKKGFKFIRTHFSDVGFRTDASAREINALLSTF